MGILVPMGNQQYYQYFRPHYQRCAKVQLFIFLDTGKYALVVLLICGCCKEYTYSHLLPHFCKALEANACERGGSAGVIYVLCIFICVFVRSKLFMLQLLLFLTNHLPAIANG